MFRKTTMSLMLSLLVLAGCGGDESGGATTTAPPSDPGGATTTVAPAAPGGTRGGTITIDGTTYEFVANQQCGIYDSVGQYYISGEVLDVENGYLAYSRDEGTHELSVDIGDVGYNTFQTNEIESTISGNVVTGTASLTPDVAPFDPVPAEFHFEC
jgi:type 1 fimbria pilin